MSLFSTKEDLIPVDKVISLDRTLTIAIVFNLLIQLYLTSAYHAALHAYNHKIHVLP